MLKFAFVKNVYSFNFVSPIVNVYIGGATLGQGVSIDTPDFLKKNYIYRKQDLYSTNLMCSRLAEWA